MPVLSPMKWRASRASTSPSKTHLKLDAGLEAIQVVDLHQQRQDAHHPGVGRLEHLEGRGGEQGGGVRRSWSFVRGVRGRILGGIGWTGNGAGALCWRALPCVAGAEEIEGLSPQFMAGGSVPAARHPSSNRRCVPSGRPCGHGRPRGWAGQGFVVPLPVLAGLPSDCPRSCNAAAGRRACTCSPPTAASLLCMLSTSSRAQTQPDS